MKISSAFFAFIPLVAAVPPSKNVVAPAPDVGNVSLCSERNFEGTCIVEHVTIGQCTSLPGAFTAQSFGPDAGLTCFVFDQANCAGRSVGPIINGQVNPIPVGFEIASFRQTLIWLKVHLINQRVGSIQKFVLCTSTFISLQGPQKSEIVTILGTSH
ncbi:hypothetical protein C8J57DRAFT_1235027 [Mycena rebaudengoi]|nr:hypothetical protein C8J57DRAFT_1235027 [Mycena rebaudengoi]